MRESGYQIRFGEVALSGTPRFRVRGARMMRLEMVRVPLPIVKGVKRAEERPLGAFSLEAIPFPGTAASSGEMVDGARRMEPILGDWRRE
jgi:hypothetical protein